MRTDSALRYEAMTILTQALGMVDAERFVSMINRDNFDYTEWRRNQWNDKTIEEVFEEATAYEKSIQ